MPIKDKEKRREYQRSLMRKRRKGLTENITPNVSPSVVVSPVSPDNLVSPEMLDPVSPEPEKVVSPCSHCPELEQQLKEFHNPTSPYEVGWKGKYLELEKKTDERWKKDTETIRRIKEKLWEKDHPNSERIKELEQQITRLQTEKNKQYEKFWKENENQKANHKQKLISLYQEINSYKEKIKELQIKNNSPIPNTTQQENQAQNKANYQQIPQQANFTSLFYDKEHKKFILHDCPDSCWTGKYCSNCSVFSTAVRP